MMRILFMGTPQFAKVVLEKIINEVGFEIVGLFAQPDRPFGRKQDLKSPATKEFLVQKNLCIPIFQPEILDEASIKNISDLRPDIILVVAYGKILPQKILSLGKCINIHGSILPKYRGASPIQEMILNDEKTYGVSVIEMEEGLDSGDILGISAFEVQEYLDIENLSNKLAIMGAELVVKILKNLDCIEPLKQHQADSSYCKKIIKQKGMVDFENAKSIYLKSLAYLTWPGIFVASGLKLFEIKLISECQNHQSGEILSINTSDKTIVVGCGCGSLEIGGLQAVGKQKVSASDYVNGKRLQVGDLLV